MPLDVLGLTEEAAEIDLIYHVAETYSEPNGKFNLFFGNAAILECKWVFPELLDATIIKIAEYEEINPDLYKKAMNIIALVEAWVTERGITFCHFSITMEGVLVD